MTNYEIHPKTRKSRSAPKKKIENRLSLYNKGPAQVNEKKRMWSVRSRECNNRKNGVEAPHGLWKLYTG